jgi:hypothetical protein
MLEFICASKSKILEFKLVLDLNLNRNQETKRKKRIKNKIPAWAETSISAHSPLLPAFLALPPRLHYA